MTVLTENDCKVIRTVLLKTLKWRQLALSNMKGPDYETDKGTEVKAWATKEVDDTLKALSLI